MKYSVSKFGLLALSVVMIGGLGACTVESDTWINHNRVEIHEDQFTDTIETARIDDGMIHAVSVYYYRFGNGPLTAAVSFDPKSKTNTQAGAEAAAQRIRDGLHKNGVKEVHITTTAAPGSGAMSTTVITFPALTAQAPTGCDMMPGYDTPTMVPATADGVAGYQYGCSIETLLSQQISRPSDLLGKPGFDTSADGRRQSNVIGSGPYYSGQPNPPLVGETTTGN